MAIENIQYIDSASISVAIIPALNATGSLLGTASYALASPGGSGVTPGGSYNISASWASASLSASYAPGSPAVSASYAITASYVATSASINFNISNATNGITVGDKGNCIIGNNMSISSWTLICNITGSIRIEVQKSNYNSYPTFTSLTNGNFAMVSNQSKNTSSTSGWTTTLNAGDIIKFFVTSSDGNIKNANLILQGMKYV